VVLLSFNVHAFFLLFIWVEFCYVVMYHGALVHFLPVYGVLEFHGYGPLLTGVSIGSVDVAGLFNGGVRFASTLCFALFSGWVNCHGITRAGYSCMSGSGL
jgi:hypothetical protein